MRDLRLEYIRTLRDTRREIRKIDKNLKPLADIEKDSNRTKQERLNAKNEAEPLRQTKKIMKGIESDVKYIVDYLRTGRKPDSYRGAEHRKAYEHKSFPPEFFERLPAKAKDDVAEVDAKFKKEYLEYLFSDVTEKEEDAYTLYKLGYKLREAAEILGITRQVVAKRVKRAGRKIRKKAGLISSP
jgi:positive control factor